MNCEQASVDLQSVPVVWKGDVYMAGHDQNRDGRIWKYSILSNSWDELSSPCYGSRKYVLTTYTSKLLLICGGLAKMPGGKVWQFDESESTFKESTIANVPNLKDAVDISAASEGSYLVVVHQIRSGRMFYVEIFDGNFWTSRTGQLSSRYIISYININVIVHHQTVYVSEHIDRKYIANVYRASLDSLKSIPTSIWTNPQGTSPIPLSRHSSLAIIGNHLVVIAADFQHTRILGYNVDSEIWLYLDEINYGFFPAPCIAVLPEGILLVIGGSRSSVITKEISGISKLDILEAQFQGMFKCSLPYSQNFHWKKCFANFATYMLSLTTFYPSEFFVLH